MRLILSIVFIMLFSACGSDNKDQDGVVRQQLLNENHQKWNTQNILSYSYLYKRVCFCPPEEDVVVMVVDGKVVGASYTPSGSTVPVDTTAKLLTVNGLFDQIQTIFDENTSQINVTYNKEFGFPERIEIDMDQAAVDGGIVYLVSDLKY